MKLKETTKAPRRYSTLGSKFETGNLRIPNGTANLRLVLSSQSQAKNMNYGPFHYVATTSSILIHYILEQVFPA